MARVTAALLLAVLLGAVLAGCGSDAPRAAERATPSPEAGTGPAAPDDAQVPPPRSAVEHLAELGAIARRHGGNRAAGTPGDRASQAYVAERLRAAGWTVGFERVRFPFFDERSPARVRGGTRGEDFATLAYSGSGRVRARTARARGLGCAADDWRAVGRGRVAVVVRGTCTFAAKARLAQRRGAAALLVISDDGVRGGSLGAPGTRIPVLMVDPALAARVLAAGRADLSVDAVSERRSTRNVLASRPGRGPVVAAGAHLDSVDAGPGANDNGSGVAALLAAAERLGPTDRPLRLGFWGAEELGLLGARAHVRRLASDERERLLGYVNLDMVATPDGRLRVASPDRRLREALTRALRGAGLRPAVGERLSGGSDHAAFADAGVPAAFVHTGLDDCYHRACDTVDRVDERLLERVSAATGDALRSLAKG